MFFATAFEPYTESALSFLNLLDILTVDNVYRLHGLKFTHMWHKGFLPKVFDNLHCISICQEPTNTQHKVRIKSKLLQTIYSNQHWETNVFL